MIKSSDLKPIARAINKLTGKPATWVSVATYDYDGDQAVVIDIWRSGSYQGNIDDEVRYKENLAALDRIQKALRLLELVEETNGTADLQTAKSISR